MGTRTLFCDPRLKGRCPVIGWRSGGPIAQRAFTLIDVLVTIAVIGLLLGMLLPALSVVRETTRKVVCSSNLRQVGLGLAMYADMYRDQLPSARSGVNFIQQRGSPVPQPMLATPSELMTLRHANVLDGWDGLGRLFPSAFAGAPGVYYCPSHVGEHPYSRYAEAWNERSGSIVGNFQYRAEAAQSRGYLRAFGPGDALVTDGMRTRSDFNHKIGCNVLLGDFAVIWYRDEGGRVRNSLPVSSEPESAAMADEAIEQAFVAIDSDAVSINSTRPRR